MKKKTAKELRNQLQEEWEYFIDFWKDKVQPGFTYFNGLFSSGGNGDEE
jgi:hypothetical protein